MSEFDAPAPPLAEPPPADVSDGDAEFGALLDEAFPLLVVVSDAELAEIEARAEAATPGPWGVGNEIEIVRGLEITGRSSYTCISSVAEIADGDDRENWSEHEGYVFIDPEHDAAFIAAARTDVPRLVASLRAARQENAVLRGWIDDAETVAAAALGDRHAPDQPLADAVGQLVQERDEALADLKRVRHALTVIQTARPPLAHSAAIVEQLALSIRAREMKPEQISADEIERGYHNAINAYREVARAILRDIDKALTVKEGADRG